MSLLGPSYSLAFGKADRQRSINMFLQRMEAEGKAQFILASVPGYRPFATIGQPLRGSITVGSRAFFVAGSGLYEAFANGTTTLVGSLGSTSGMVSMAYGLFQLVIVDGNGYVFTLANNTFQQITDEDFPGADTVDFQGNYFTLTKDRKGQQFYITSINDATMIDGLDFASAESAPDDVVAHITVQAGGLIFGTNSCELFVNTGNADFPLERSQGAGFMVGLMARRSLVRFDNGCAWVGQDETGAGVVYVLAGGQPKRISTQSQEQALQRSTDLTQCTAYAYQQNGLTFYALNAPGLKTTLVYEVSTSSWHERADLGADGHLAQDRGVCHTFAFGKHLIGGSDGVIYQLDDTYYRKGSDPLVRERISPHQAQPGRTRQFFEEFAIDCTTGANTSIDPQLELSWADYQGPSSFKTPRLQSTGKIGEEFARVVFRRLGQSRDRVWRLRFTMDAPFSIIDIFVKASPGVN